MSRLEVDKERFKGFLDQFIGDAPYQIELIRKIMSQMPAQVVNQFIEELYYEHVYNGPLYKVQHAVFKDEVHYFPNYQSLLRFLNDVNKFSKEFNTDALLTIDKKTLAKRVKDNLPLCGYIITMQNDEEDVVDGREQPTRYSQFQ